MASDQVTEIPRGGFTFDLVQRYVGRAPSTQAVR